jgi:hypothetical protein
LSDPAARHPRFVAQYPGGGGDYQSNWLMCTCFMPTMLLTRQRLV